MNPRVILVGSAASGAAVIALLDAAAKAGILFLAAALIVWSVRKRASASTRHLIWLCALCGALLLPLSFRFLPQWRILPSWMCWQEAPRLFAANPAPAPEAIVQAVTPVAPSGDIPQAAPSPVVAMRHGEARPPSPPPRPLRLKARLILTAWASVAVLCLLPVAASLLKLRRVSRQSKKIVGGPLFDAVSEVAGELGLRKMPQVLSGETSEMPMVWGIIHPTLLLPAGAAEWPSLRLRTVLLHELCHVSRRDPCSLLLAHLAVAVHWFNPLAWLALASVRREQELACDDCVLRHGVPSSGYAGEMLAISTSHAAPKHLAALAMARSSCLDMRIATILDPSRNRRAATRRLVAAAAGIALLVGLPVAMLRAATAEPAKRGRLLDRNGVVLAENNAEGERRYPCDALAAHLIGYLETSGNQGVTGVEMLFDDTLRQGHDVSLTLDAPLQHHTEAVLRSANIGRGAVVVLDCADGSVLAGASVPSFNPNDFVSGIDPDRFRSYSEDPATPLRNRMMAAHPPGSPFRLVTALAACRAGNSGDHHTCEGFVRYGNHQLGCWVWNATKGSHGNLSLHDAITRSCSPYFMLAAEKTGPEKLAETGMAMGFGQASGIGLPGESAGIIPSPEHPDSLPHGHSWSAGYTANLAIGQGLPQVTPLQLAAFAAGLGSGRIHEPRLNRNSPPQLRIDLVEAGWKEEDLETIRSALANNVWQANGTARRAQSKHIEIAGASGTSQAVERGERTHFATFIACAPATAPRYAIAVVVQNGSSGGRVAAPLARMILEGLAMDLPDPHPVSPLGGHFDRIDVIE